MNMGADKKTTISVKGAAITILSDKDGDYISLTDMLKAKDGEFFIADWLRNRNTVEFLGIWESVFNPSFNYGEFAIIKSQAGLNSYPHRCHQGAPDPAGNHAGPGRHHLRCRGGCSQRGTFRTDGETVARRQFQTRRQHA